MFLERDTESDTCRPSPTVASYHVTNDPEACLRSSTVDHSNAVIEEDEEFLALIALLFALGATRGTEHVAKVHGVHRCTRLLIQLERRYESNMRGCNAATYRRIFSNPEVDAPARVARRLHRCEQHDVAIACVERAIQLAFQLLGKEILDFPTGDAGRVRDVVVEEFTVVQLRPFDLLVPTSAGDFLVVVVMPVVSRVRIERILTFRCFTHATKNRFR